MNEYILSGFQKGDEPRGNPITTIDGKPIQGSPEYVDPDTVKVDGQSYRIRGFNAPETAKFQGGIFVPAQDPNVAQLGRDVDTIARLGGYTNLKTEGRDPYGRVLAKQVDSYGNSLGDTLTVLGFVDPNIHSTDEAVRKQSEFKAVSRLLPELGQSDPSITLARQRAEEQRAQAGGDPLYVAKLYTPDERTYAAIKNSVGIRAAREQIEEIDRLEGLLARDDLKPEIREKLSNDLVEARERLFYAGVTPDLAGGTMVRHDDRNIMNKAHNEFRTSFDRGVLDLQKGFYGFLQQVGDSQKWEWLATKGREGALAKETEIDMMASTLSSFRDIRTDNSWDTITDAATYASNLIASTLPAMALMISSGAVASTVVTGATAFGLGAAPMSMIYSGNFYADQPDDKKNASLALSLGITAGVLDRLGLDALASSGSLFTMVGRKAILEEMMATGRYATLEAAENTLKNATKQELIELSKSGAQFATQQYASKEAMIRGAVALSGKAGVESSTESLQTLAEMVASSGEANLDVQFEKNFYDNLVDAAVGGSLVGGIFAGSGSMINAAQWHSAKDALELYNRQITEAQRFNNDQVLKAKTDGTGFNSVLEAARFQLQSPSDATYKSLRELPAKEGTWNGFKSIVTDPMRLVRQLVDTAVPSITNPDGTFKTNLAYLKAIMGDKGILPGDSYAGFRQRLIGNWSTATPEELATRLNTSVYNTNRLVKEAWVNTWSKGERLTDSSPQAVELQAWKDRVDAITASMRQMADELGIDAPELSTSDPLFETAAIHAKTLQDNRERVIATMMRNGSSRYDAETAIDNVISGDPLIASPARRWMANYGVFNDPSLNDVFETNVFNTMESLKQAVAGRAAEELYLGRNGEVLARLLQDAWNTGEFESQEQYMDTVKNVRDWYDIINGSYNPIKYPFLEKMVGWGTTMTMLASLGKATISSLPEIVLATLGTKGDKVSQQIKTTFKTFATEYRSDINKGASYALAQVGIEYARNAPHPRLQAKLEALEKEWEEVATDPNASLQKIEAIKDKILRYHQKDLGRSLFERLGYNDTGYNTQARFELPSANMKKTMQVFAAIIGLRSLTDATRIATLSVAADTIISKLTSLQAIPREQRMRVLAGLEQVNNQQGQNLRELQEYGMNVLDVLEGLDYIESKGLDPYDIFTKDNLVNNTYPQGTIERTLQDNILTTLGNMVDSKVVNPQPHNMPKYYYDPRFRIFTVMTRFVAALTSTVLPRLYMNYIKDGSVGMRYQAFVTIGLALAFAYMANMLKDELSYGEENPYIKGAVKEMQRTVYGSGLLGRFEDVVDLASPLYPDRGPSFLDNPLKATYGQLKDMSPVVGWTDRVLRAMYAGAEGDTQTAVRLGVRSAPLIGSFPQAAKEASELTK